MKFFHPNDIHIETFLYKKIHDYVKNIKFYILAPFPFLHSWKRFFSFKYCYNGALTGFYTKEFSLSSYLLRDSHYQIMFLHPRTDTIYRVQMRQNSK